MPFPFVPFSITMKTISLLGRKVELAWITGRIPDGDGARGQVVLVDGKRHRYVFPMADSRMTCEPGHEVTVFHIHPPGKSDGYYAGVYDHTTGDHRWDEQAVGKLVKPALWPYELIFTLFLGMAFWSGYFGSLFLVAALLAFVYIQVIRARIRRVTRAVSPEELGAG